VVFAVGLAGICALAYALGAVLGMVRRKPA
jgi:hypothetical protein